MLQDSSFAKIPFALGLVFIAALPLDNAFAGFDKTPPPLTTLYSFKGGADGSEPNSTLIFDKAGNIYGTTLAGGASNLGTVFKLAPDGTKTVLHSFAGGASDGASPSGPLVLDKAGNLYGTTVSGGNSDCLKGDEAASCGTVYRLAPDGTETLLHLFENNEGFFPSAGVIRDSAGNLYGTTWLGGTQYGGTVFKLAPDGTETIVHNFSSPTDGSALVSGLLLDKQGNLFGTTEDGGPGGKGTAFKIAEDGALTILHSFSAAADGWRPTSSLVADEFGNLYGTTDYGPGPDTGFGTVFELQPDGTYVILYAFEGGASGIHPGGGLIIDKRGHLFGTAPDGGYRCQPHNDCGVVFRLDRVQQTVLHAFRGSDGAYPLAGLTAGPDGFLYGTTALGRGKRFGTIFKIKK